MNESEEGKRKKEVQGRMEGKKEAKMKRKKEVGISELGREFYVTQTSVLWSVQRSNCITLKQSSPLCLLQKMVAVEQLRLLCAASTTYSMGFSMPTLREKTVCLCGTYMTSHAFSLYY